MAKEATKTAPPTPATPKAVLLQTFVEDMETIVPYLEALLPYKGGVSKFKQMTHLAILRNPDLLNYNRKSLLLAILWCAYKDLEPGVEDGAWLVPFKGIVTPIPAYKGLIKKAVETETASDVQPYGVYENDDFEFTLGLNPQITHQPPKLGVGRGKLIGAYVVITKPDGTKRFHVMDRPDIEKIRNAGAAWRNKPGEGPWADWEGAMFLKTIIKQGLKYLPVKPAFRDLIVEDGRIEAGESVATLLRESGKELPEGLDKEEPPGKEAEKEPEPDTSEFDKLVDEKLQASQTAGEYKEKLQRIEAHIKFLAEGHKMTPAQMKVKAGSHFLPIEGEKVPCYWFHFEKWEAEKYPAPPTDEQAAEQEAEPALEPEVVPFETLKAALWNDVVKKGAMQALEGTKYEEITPENYDKLKAAVDAYKPKRGK